MWGVYMSDTKLEKSLIDLLKEEQAKLGFMEEEVRLYYPLMSLNHFFNAEDDETQMAERLSHLPESLTEKLGDIVVTHKNDRFCFHIPAQGSIYVHENMKENEFIKELVGMLAEHGTTMEQIFALFDQHSEHVVRSRMDSDEFDWLVRFEDDAEDPYYYCFKDEGYHIIYHRFLKEDYEDFGF